MNSSRPAVWDLSMTVCGPSAHKKRQEKGKASSLCTQVINHVDGSCFSATAPSAVPAHSCVAAESLNKYAFLGTLMSVDV